LKLWLSHMWREFYKWKMEFNIFGLWWTFFCFVLLKNTFFGGTDIKTGFLTLLYNFLVSPRVETERRKIRQKYFLHAILSILPSYFRFLIMTLCSLFCGQFSIPQILDTTAQHKINSWKHKHFLSGSFFTCCVIFRAA
jgi:hypothetical protein